MEPRLFESNSKLRRAVKDVKVEGITPVKRFDLIFKLVSFTSDPIGNGILLLKEL